jgi:hypothetical protein
VELLGIQEAADATMRYVHTHRVNREEHLLGIPNRVRDVVELGIHRGGSGGPDGGVGALRACAPPLSRAPRGPGAG